MILRHAILDEHARQVHLPRSDSRQALAARIVDAEGAPGVEAIEEPQVPVRETLTFEAVAAWLAVQDEPTRSACASILSDELTRVHEIARTDGLALGESQGREAARQASQGVLAALGGVARAIEDELAQEQSKLADLCADIVAEAFAKIAGRTLSTRKAAVGAVTQVLGRVKEGRDLVVRVSPADLPLLQAEQTHLSAVVPGRALTLVADARIELGGCIVESNLGTLDGRMDGQLRELYATLRAARAARVERQ
jgi:flagellar biosynthesis/type III secretory pathway protein FliH